MPVAAVIVLTAVVLVVVAGLGVLIFRLQRRTQRIVPRVAEEAERSDRVVAVDDQGRPVTEAEDAPQGPQRDATGFEQVLAEELDARHPQHPEDAPRGEGS